MDIKYEKANRIAIFSINRPASLNALSGQTRSELHEAVVDFDSDPDMWVGIITGVGDKSFSVGADIKELALNSAKPRTQGLQYILDTYKPMIAAINGYCLGGGLELALGCDLRIAAEHARMGLPEILRGRVPGGGGTQRLPRMLPWCKAAEMLLMGKPIDAQEAYRIGLVNKVVPIDTLMPVAREWAASICEAGPLAVRATKEAMTRGYNMSLADAFALERMFANRIRITEDCAEGARAFAEKRKPEYRGR